MTVADRPETPGGIVARVTHWQYRAEVAETLALNGSSGGEKGALQSASVAARYYAQHPRDEAAGLAAEALWRAAPIPRDFDVAVIPDRRAFPAAAAIREAREQRRTRITSGAVTPRAAEPAVHYRVVQSPEPAPGPQALRPPTPPRQVEPDIDRETYGHGRERPIARRY